MLGVNPIAQQKDSSPWLSTAHNSGDGEHRAPMSFFPLFAGLSRQECMDITSCALARRFARNEVLFVQGQPVRYLILLQSGNVKHTRVSQNGKEALLRISAMGNLVNVLSEAPCGHSCSAYATERCEALRSCVTANPFIWLRVNSSYFAT
jgi:signal-transduction protein with cAMP-binding, CBS, and nucleotidyltransferase domain